MFCVSLHATGGFAFGEAPEARGPRQCGQPELSGSQETPLSAKSGVSKAASKIKRRADFINLCR